MNRDERPALRGRSQFQIPGSPPKTNIIVAKSTADTEQVREPWELTRSDAKSESWGLENLFERSQISGETRMPNLMERKSTRRVENGAAHQTSASNESVIWR
jgi:hypothetical protein